VLFAPVHDELDVRQEPFCQRIPEKTITATEIF
jgi:hypothetical protein